MTSTERAAAIAAFQTRYKLAHRRLWGDVPSPPRIRCKPHPAVETPPAITFSDWLQLTEARKVELVSPILPRPVVTEPVSPPAPLPPHVPIEAAQQMADKMHHQKAALCMQRFTVTAIIEVVAAYFNLTAEAILSHRRKAPIVLARYCAMYLAGEITRRSTCGVGYAMHRDHSTVFHAYRKIGWRIAHEPATAAAVAELRAILTAPRAAVPTMAEIFAEAAVCESAD